MGGLEIKQLLCVGVIMYQFNKLDANVAEFFHLRGPSAEMTQYIVVNIMEKVPFQWWRLQKW